MDSTRRLVIAVDSRGAEKDVRRFTRELEAVQRAGENADRQSAATGTAFTKLGRVAVGAVAAFAGFKAVSGSVAALVAASRDVESVNTRLEAFASNADAERAFLEQTAESFSTNFQTLASSYSDFLALTKSGLITQRESRELLVGYTSIAKVAAVSNTQLEQSVFGVTQALSTGIVTTEDFNQAVGSIPILAGDLDRAAGLAAGGFKNLVKEGKVTSDFFKGVLIKALADYEDQARNTTDTIEKSLTRLDNQFERFKGQFSTPVSIAVRVASSTAESALDGLNDQIDIVQDGAGALSDRLESSGLSVGAFGVNVEVLNEKLGTTSVRFSDVSTATSILQAALNPLDTIGNIFDKFDSEQAAESVRRFNAGLLETNETTRQTLIRLRALQQARLDALQSGDGFLGIQADASIASDIEVVTSRVEALSRAIGSMSEEAIADARATSDEFDALGSTITNLVPDVEGGQSLLDKILPDQKKLREITEQLGELDDFLESKSIDESSFDAAVRALEQQREKIEASINGTEELERQTAQVTREVSSLNDQLATQVELIQRRRDAAEATINRNLQSNLPRGVTGGLSDDQAEALRVKAQQTQLDALAELEEKETRQLERAVSERQRIRERAFQDQISAEREFRDRLSEARTVIDPFAEEQRQYQRQTDALAAQLQFRIITQDQFNDESVAGAIRHTGELASIETERSANILQAAIAGNSDREEAEEAHARRLAAIARYSVAIEELKAAYANGEISAAEFHQRIEAAEQAHQERMAGITGAGAYHRFQQIAAVSSALLGAYTATQEAEARDALTRARNDAEAAASAREAYEQSATDQNQALASSLSERAAISEAAARKEFEQQKEARLAQAKISGLTAVANAFATGNFYTGVALAAAAYANYRDITSQIKSTQFNGGSDLSGSVSAGGSTSTSATPFTQPTTQQQTVAPVIIIQNSNPFTTQADADRLMQDSLARLSREGIVTDADGRALNTTNARTINWSSQAA